jgi:Leucine-rich repeat (LRR) protein
MTNNNLNSFTSLPESKQMDSLMLAYNRIDYMENFERVPNLTSLDLHNNKMTALPDSVSNLKNLMTLKVSNNDLSDLNPRLALLPNLVRINIEGNPLKSIKATIRSAGAD